MLGLLVGRFPLTLDPKITDERNSLNAIINSYLTDIYLLSNKSRFNYLIVSSVDFIAPITFM